MKRRSRVLFLQGVRCWSWEEVGTLKKNTRAVLLWLFYDVIANILIQQIWHSYGEKLSILFLLSAHIDVKDCQIPAKLAWTGKSAVIIWFLRMLSMNLPVKLLRMDYCNATVHVVYTVCYTINCICQCIVLYFKTYFHFRKGNSKPRVIFIGCWWVI